MTVRRRPRLPPANLLRTFEAAGRHMSFKQAAAELHVTPSAVSHQVRALEDYLGFPLFRRLNRALELTAAGRDYLDHVVAAFSTLRHGHQAVCDRHCAAALSILVTPLFDESVIEPNRERFERQLPGVDLRVASVPSTIDLDQAGADGVIAVGTGRWPDKVGHRILALEAVPVSGPALAAGIDDLDDLLGHRLLHARAVPDAWPWWVRIMGRELAARASDRWFKDPVEMLAAASREEGVALTMLPVAGPWLEDGRLALALPWPAPLLESFYLACRPEVAESPSILRLRDWLLTHVPSRPVALG